MIQSFQGFKSFNIPVSIVSPETTFVFRYAIATSCVVLLIVILICSYTTVSNELPYFDHSHRSKVSVYDMLLADM